MAYTVYYHSCATGYGWKMKTKSKAEVLGIVKDFGKRIDARLEIWEDVSVSCVYFKRGGSFEPEENLL